MGFLGTAVPVHADVNDVTVMTRNIYLGADVGPAMKLLPNFSAAAQFMWDQVHKTDFSMRAPKLAAEIVTEHPDVVAIQEATTWICTPGPFSRPVVVYDFVKQLLEQTQIMGTEYVLAAANGRTAYNEGFAINPIPMVTMAHDPATFQPLFGKDDAACGFRIADAILIRSDHVTDVLNVGTTEYKKSYTIIPTLMTVHRGYSWADILIHGVPTRFVATHLESLFDAGKVPPAKAQADQLINDLKNVTMPLVVMGDFNSDPRDPRPQSDPNLGEQPFESAACPVQKLNPSKDSAHSECSPYWSMVQAGYTDVGPDPQQTSNFSWGYTALLNGFDKARPQGFTDRLDYVFTRKLEPGAGSRLVGNTWPTGSDMWQCGAEICAPTDHAGVVATLNMPHSTQVDPAPDAHRPFPIGFWKAIGILICLLILRKILKRRQPKWHSIETTAVK